MLKTACRLNQDTIYKISSHIVPTDTLPVRFSEYAIGLFPALPSRNSVKKAIKSGALRLDSQRAETGSWVNPGQEVALYELEQSIPKAYHTSASIAVLYEDDQLAVVNKPAGLPTSGNQFRTLENALIDQLSPSPAEDAMGWFKPVHRLDAPTSGLVIMAKTLSARIALGSMFEKKEIRKKYQAIVMGSSPDKGYLDSPVNGQQAHTEFRLLKAVPSLKSGSLSLLELEPHTGRTHQLRIQLADAGYPILGDPLYGRPGAILKGKGLFLCAVELSFEHPILKMPLQITIASPQKFETRLQSEQVRWERFQQKGK